MRRGGGVRRESGEMMEMEKDVECDVNGMIAKEPEERGREERLRRRGEESRAGAVEVVIEWMIMVVMVAMKFVRIRVEIVLMAVDMMGCREFGADGMREFVETRPGRRRTASARSRARG